MRKKIEFSVGSVAGALDRFEQVWRRADQRIVVVWDTIAAEMSLAA